MVFAVEVPLDEFLSWRGRVVTPRPERCPSCRHPWVTFDGWWTRQTRRGPVDIHRVLCAGCKASHSCWPDVLVGRRVDLAVVIGAALEAKAAGWGHRRIGVRLGVPGATVRGWLRRFATLAGGLTGRLLAVAADADPVVRAPPPGPPLVVAVAAVGVAAAALASLSGEPVDRWRFAVTVTAGGLLSRPTQVAPAASR
jgi:hypothetical protein